MNATHKTVPLQQREPLGMRIISLSNQLKQKNPPPAATDEGFIYNTWRSAAYSVI